MSSVEQSVTYWVDQLKAGHDEAAQEIWNRYFQKLIWLARNKMRGMSRRVADEEDVVISAFHSFCEGVADGRFPKLDDRHDLWKILVTITARKAVAQQRHQTRDKRGGGDVRGDSIFLAGDFGDKQRGFDQFTNAEPSPEFAAQVAEQYDQLLSSLDDSMLQRIAVLKLQNYTNAEIAGQFDCTPRTVERKLERIRAIWSHAESHESGYF